MCIMKSKKFVVLFGNNLQIIINKKRNEGFRCWFKLFYSNVTLWLHMYRRKGFEDCTHIAYANVVFLSWHAHRTCIILLQLSTKLFDPYMSSLISAHNFRITKMRLKTLCGTWRKVCLGGSYLFISCMYIAVSFSKDHRLCRAHVFSDLYIVMQIEQ